MPNSRQQRALNKLFAALLKKVFLHENWISVNASHSNHGITKALIRGTYELPEVELIKNFIHPGDRVVEVGTGIGVTSLIIYDIVGESNFRAFEADPRNYNITIFNGKLNSKDIPVQNAAIVDHVDDGGTVTFNISSNISSSSILEREDTVHNVKVPAISLIEAITSFNANVIVMDVEGAEEKLLAQSDSLKAIRTILVETHHKLLGERRLTAMIESLVKGGYNIVASDEHNRFLALERDHV